MTYEFTPEFASKLDTEDKLSSFRSKFFIPQKKGKDVIYLCGNSLGLQPKAARENIDQFLEKWKTQAVEGHFTDPDPWVDYHELGRETVSELIGARTEEVVIMNSLTVNLHLMLASFYNPTAKKNKILIEQGAFPSDHFAVSTFMELKGVSPKDHLVEVPYSEDSPLQEDSILEMIESYKDELALVMLPGVQYYTGQVLDIQAITRKCHEYDMVAGFDLAHAIGNIPMNLHEDQVDFAVWCSYKYLNSGPGNVAGVFIHQNHNQDTHKLRLGGWWGQRPDIRFLMETRFQPMTGAGGWMLSNVNVLANTTHIASLDIFKEAGIKNLRQKSLHLTGYLAYLLHTSDLIRENVQIITPAETHRRGCQLSLYLEKDGKKVFDYLTENGVVLDWRESNLKGNGSGIIRVAPTPLYNKFSEVYEFVKLLEHALTNVREQ